MNSFCKKVNFPLSKIRLHYQTVIGQRLTVFHQLFSWTSFGPNKCPIAKMIGSQDHLTVLGVFPWYSVYILRTTLLKFFSKSIIFEIRHCRKIHCPLCKFSLHSLFLGQRLAAFHQLFSRISVGPSKCPIHKMIGSLGHPTVWGVLKYHVYYLRTLSQKTFPNEKLFKVGIVKSFTVL